MVGEPVEECTGQAFVTEDGRPLVEWQIGRDDRSAALVALADQLEEKFGTGFRQWDEAELIDDQQFVPSTIGLPLLPRLALVPRYGAARPSRLAMAFTRKIREELDGSMV